MDWQTGASRQVNIGGAALELRCWGPSPDRAATFVLLHEGLGSVSLWRDIPQTLSAMTGMGVLAYSRAGYGQSDPADLPRPIDYMTREALAVLPLVLEAAGIERAVLAGHSDGASIAAIYGGKVADARVKALILIAPHFFTESAGLEAILQAKTAYETTGLKERLARHHKDPENAFRGWNDAWLNPEFARWNIEDVIDGIAVPVLAIQGMDDQFGTMAQIDRLQAGLRAPFERLDLPQCQHAPQFEQKDQTLNAIAVFVRGIVE